MQTHFTAWQRWLVMVTLVWMAFSIMMVITPIATRQFFSVLFYYTPERIDSFPSPVVEYISLLHAVLGAVMMGWGVTILFTLLGPFGRCSSESWNTLSISLLAWFIPDTFFSLCSGFWQNAVFNAVFVVLFAIPLAATFRECRGRQI
jgi:hypothetical protein